jgi:hypothetical protein
VVHGVNNERRHDKPDNNAFRILIHNNRPLLQQKIGVETEMGWSFSTTKGGLTLVDLMDFTNANPHRKSIPNTLSNINCKS